MKTRSQIEMGSQRDEQKLKVSQLLRHWNSPGNNCISAFVNLYCRYFQNVEMRETRGEAGPEGVGRVAAGRTQWLWEAGEGPQGDGLRKWGAVVPSMGSQSTFCR